MRFTNKFISLADLYLAYRKAKVEAFYESSHHSALIYALYEKNLDKNLRRLLDKLRDDSSTWADDPRFIGDFVYAPKGVEDPTADAALHYRALDPLADWYESYERRGRTRVRAEFRLVIAATVDFQIISALWIVKVGVRLDGCLDDRHSYGNRLRKRSPIQLNEDCSGLFAPYFSDYRKWRERGLKSMTDALRRGQEITAVTMDVRQFYHRVNPDFLLRRSFLTSIGVRLSRNERRLTSDLLRAIRTWYGETPDYADRKSGALPVGLSASKVIANVVLAEFDKLVAARLDPIYYGRYVDDVFLVLPKPPDVYSASDFVKWFSTRLAPAVRVERDDSNGAPSLRLRFGYARDSDLVFASAKQKIFNLSSEYGIDLVDRIADKIREHSSEYRLLPALPPTNVAMASRALLATPDATLEADALRKAEAVSVRRLGFSLLIRDAEAYERDLSAAVWRDLRTEFYGLVQRHLLTPKGFFDYVLYFHRVFGLMIACGDLPAAMSFLERLVAVIQLLKRTTIAGSVEAEKFNHCREYYARALLQAAMQASTVKPFAHARAFVDVLNALRKVSPAIKVPTSTTEVRSVSALLLRSDWGRRPYKHLWLFGAPLQEPQAPTVPHSLSVHRQLRLPGIRRFQRLAELPTPYWPALAFPTRPLTVAEMAIVAPDLLRDERRFRQAIMALRGAIVRDGPPLGFYWEGRDDDLYFRVPVAEPKETLVAITSVETTNNQWVRAARRKPDLSIKRYETLRGLVNRILKDGRPPRYVVFPELSMPLKWGIGMANKLAQHGISMLAGVEYYSRKRELRNDCLVSLVTNWPGYTTNIIRFQAKLAPAHDERRQLRKLGQVLHTPRPPNDQLPIYLHGKLFFGILLCSDLTNISNRRYFQGAIDALFVLEWNRDLTTFGFLVEATSHDVHAFVIQVNNRQYGDSRLRGPFREDHKRDSVRVKGGITDYYVLAKVDYESLRQFQRGKGKQVNGDFKPTPIGFQMSPQRRKV